MDDQNGCSGNRKFGLLSERTRRIELALFAALMIVLSGTLIWAGACFIVELEAHPSVLPVTVRGAAAVLLGGIYILVGAATLFSTWAMWRLFR